MERILATTSSFGSACPDTMRRLSDAGYELVTNPYGRKLTEDELASLLAEHRPIGLLAGTEPVTAAVIDGASDHLRVISRIGVGWDNVDHAAAKRHNISVRRTEGVLDQAVAELTLGMMLDALRHVSLHDRSMRSGVWKKRMGRLLSGKTVGIVGYGAIGRRVGELCMAFGARVACADAVRVESEAVAQFNISELARRVDILTVHASGSECLVGRAVLAGCKPGLVVINTARGGMVDEDALAEGLGNGRIAYACLDVFREEPYKGPLLELDNTILTAHVGSYAQEARIDMENLAVDNLLAELGG